MGNTRRLAAVGLAVAGLVTAGPTAYAATAHAVTSGCSGQRIGKSICVSVAGPPGSPTTVTATVNVSTGGRGWGGRIILTGPHGQLLVTDRHTLPAPGSYAVTVAADGPGQYCGLDQAWDGYSQTYAYQEDVCVTAP